MVSDQTIVVVVAEILLGIAIIFVPDMTLKGTAVGAAVGIVGGHLNGSASAKQD